MRYHGREHCKYCGALVGPRCRCMGPHHVTLVSPPSGHQCEVFKPDFFKQDTPKMQSAALMQGVLDHVLNMQKGILPSEKALENMQLLLSHLALLHNTQLPDEWKGK